MWICCARLHCPPPLPLLPPTHCLRCPRPSSSSPTASHRQPAPGEDVLADVAVQGAGAVLNGELRAVGLRGGGGGGMAVVDGWRGVG